MSEVRTEDRDGVVWLTFDRTAQRNAMTWAMYEALEETCAAVDADPGVRGLVLRGAGGRAFVAGTDIAQFRSVRSAGAGVEYERTIDRVVDRLEAVTKPTVALIEGAAVGAGLVLAATCDLRVATSSARLGMPIARTLGNTLSMANFARLVALVGEARVKELLLTARLLDASEALAWGMLTEVATGNAEVRAQALVELAAAHAPITVDVTKTALARLRKAGLPDGDDLIGRAYGSEDFANAVEAFITKGKPDWTGR